MGALQEYESGLLDPPQRGVMGLGDYKRSFLDIPKLCPSDIATTLPGGKEVIRELALNKKMLRRIPTLHERFGSALAPQ